MMCRAICMLLVGCATAHLHRYAGVEAPAKEQFNFEHFDTVEIPHPYYGVVNKSTFRSHPIKLSNGEAWFTLPTVNRLPFPKPGRPFVITSMKPDMVEESGRRPPVSELYPHHWLMYDKLKGGSGDNLGCGGEDTFVSNIFGAGAEMRGVHYVYPNGYGYFSTEGQGYWSANIHIINQIDLSAQHFQDQPDPQGAAVKACIECNYSPGNTGIDCKKGDMGNFGCCIDGVRCLTNDMKNKTKTTYYLQYELEWTTDLSLVKPLRYGVIDTFHCSSLGNIAPNMVSQGHKCDDKICVGEIERTMDKNGTIIWAYGHQHFGAINASLYLNGEYVCTSTPHYGTDPTNPILNEKGYVTGFDLCLHADGAGGAASKKTIHVKKGDKMKVQSLYSVEEVDPRIQPMPGGAHGGVMGLFYFYLNEDGGYKCSRGQCVATTQDGVDLATCQKACGPDGVLV